MYAYQEEEGQIGLTFGIILNQNDVDQILGHNPLNIEIAPLRINIFFCEPSNPVSFDISRKTYFISLCYREIKFLKNNGYLLAAHIIEGVPFILIIFFMKNMRYFKGRSSKIIKSYLLLSGSTLE